MLCIYWWNEKQTRETRTGNKSNRPISKYMRHVKGRKIILDKTDKTY